jgi:hypothetical protein
LSEDYYGMFVPSIVLQMRNVRGGLRRDRG